MLKVIESCDGPCGMGIEIGYVDRFRNVMTVGTA